MRSTLPELKAVSMRRGVADILREALLSGDFSPGEELLEVHLASQLKVSRGPIREALLILSEEGLVVHSQNRGFSVLQLTEEDLQEISEVRLPLEALALELSRDRISKEKLAELEELKNRIMENLSAGDYRQSVRNDLEFHQIIWESTENAWLVAALKRIMIPRFTFTMVYRMKEPKLTPAVLKDTHDAYLQFLRRESSRSAEECVRLHLSLGP